MLFLGALAPTGLMAQTTLSAGDIAFVGFNGVDDQSTGNNSNDKFSFVLLKSVTANTRIFFTDFGWLTGGGFQTVSPTTGVGSKDDGIISWTASTSLAAGTQVVIQSKYNLSASTGTVAGIEQIPGKTFYMNIGDPGADNIFAYQAATARDANPILLAGIRTAGTATTWDATLTNTEFTPAKTTLPAALTANGVNAALYLKGTFYTIGIYKCTLSNGFPNALRNTINNPANWGYPNPGTFCEGYIYAPNDPDCPQSSIPAGYNLPINCTFTIAQVQIASQPVSKTVCAGQPVSFTSTASNATAYQWQVSTNGGGSFSNLSDGGVYTGATSITLSISNTTGFNGYQYRLIASESTVPSSATSSAATLTVNTVPTLTLNGSANPTTCGGANGSISFTTNLTNGSYSLSYTGTGSPKTVTVAGNAFTLTGLGAGSYSNYSITNSGCTGSLATPVNLTDPTPPTAGLLNNGPLSCSMTSVTLTASGGGTYQFSAGATQIGSSNQATVTTAGPYSVTATSASGCSATATTTVTGNQTVPTAGLTNDGPLSCSKTSVTLTASGGGTYQFSAGATQINGGNTATVSTAGPYSVTVTGTGGCSAVATTTVTGNQTAPTVSISANPSLTITQGESTTLTANVSGGTPPFGYGWSTGASSNSIVASTDGPYSVTVTGVNGCSATASVTVTVIQPSGPFAITGVTTLSCETISAGQRRVTFNPRYASQDSSPISFSVVNELTATTNPGPYTLNLYTDNPVITLSATQNGANTLFAYNWLSACSSSTANTPPTVVNPVSPQSATVGIGYTLSLANVFTDAETPNSLVLSVTGLPAGLNFVAPSTISGTPSMSGVSTVTVTATDPGGMMASTSFTITVNPAGGTPPPPTGTFSITSVQTISCEVLSAGERSLTFNPQYAGVNGAPISFSVVNELAPTTNPGPYTLNLYTDNSVVTLQAVQSGISSSFAYNWLSACSSSTANTPPTVANPVGPQSATVGVAYTLSLANVFTDAETPNQLTLSVSGLPAGLSFTAPSTISGTPSMSGVSNVTVTATDPGSMSASTSFTITVNPAAGTPPPTATFSITGVTTVSCEVLSAGERRLTFNPRYAGLDGSPVSFSVVNELAPTTNPGPYTLNLYTDNPVINLRAVQSGVSTSFSYGWLAACNASARTAAEQVPQLQVRLLGNPVVGKTIRVEIQGAESQAVWLRVQNLSGGLVDEQVIGRAASTETVELSLGTQGGIYLLQVSNGNQQRTLKVIKP